MGLAHWNEERILVLHGSIGDPDSKEEVSPGEQASARKRASSNLPQRRQIQCSAYPANTYFALSLGALNPGTHFLLMSDNILKSMQSETGREE